MLLLEMVITNYNINRSILNRSFTGSDQKKWPSSQNVTTTLSYPSTGGNGAYLTYILINCEQSSNIGKAFVTQGGVQQHFVQIVIETSYTTYFNYAAFFYGVQ